MSQTTPPADDSGHPVPSSPKGGRGRRWLKPLAIVATLAAVWTVGVGTVLPGVLKPRIEAAAQDALGVPVTINEVALSPWTLTARVQGMQVGESVQPMMKVQHLEAQVSLESLWRFAPVLRRVHLEQPEVWLARLDAERFNISPVIERLRARSAAEPADDDGPARFAVFNISLHQGAIHYDDRVLHQTHLVDGIELGVPFVSSLPSQIEVAVQPLLKARVNGSPLEVDGTTLPFHDGHRSELNVRWRDVDVAAWLRHAQPLLPKPWSLTPRGGRLSTDLKVVFEQTPDADVPRLMVQGALSLDDLDVGLPVVPGVAVADQTLGPVDVGWKALRLQGLNLQPLVRAFSVAEVDLAQGRVAVQGRVKGGVVAWPRVQGLNASVRGLDTQPEAKPAAWTLALDDAAGSHLEARGGWHVAQAQGDAALTLANGAVPAWWTTIASRMGVPVSPQTGRLGVRAQLAVQTQPVLSVRVSDGLVDVEGFEAQLLPKLPAARGDAAGWQALTLEGVQAQWTAQQPSAPVWQVARLTLADAHGRWHDTTPAVPAAWQWAKSNVVVEGLSQDFSRELQVQLESQAQGAGRVRFKGGVRPQPLKVQGQLAVQSLDLRVLQPYLSPHLNVVLNSAQAQADGRLSLEMRASQAGQNAAQAITARWRGQLGLDRLHLLDQVNDADVLRWRSLALAGTDLRWQRGELVADLGRIALKDFYGRVIVQPDGRLNLAQLVRSADETGQAPTSLTTPQAPGAAAPVSPPAVASAASAASPEATPAPGPDLRWRGIALSGGQVDFTDLYIKPNYSARLTQLGGTISAVAARQPEPADVQLAGKVDDAAPLQIKGRLHPLGPRLYTDIEASAKGVELTRLTPYAARYAGYAIERGTLSVDVRYKVEDGRLEASNKLFLDQLTFGEPSGDPQATRLPVLLAVALLKNRQGEIDINLPISGSLDDPQFSVGGIVWRVIVNLITKAVTAPFSLLMGGGSDEAGQVHFAPGRSDLDDAARTQLDALAAKLLDRPALKLDAVGQAYAAQDVNGLRESHVQRLMRTAKARAQDVPIEDVRVAPEEADRWLAAAYRAADIKKPRNLVGIPKSLPPSEQRALLAASAPADAAALKALADRRADVVKAYLIERLPAERVRLGASKLPEAGGESAGPKGLVGVSLALQ